MAINLDKITITQVDEIMAFNNAKELEFIMDEVTDVTISNAEEKTDITGRGGRVIGSLKKNKTVTISGTNGLIVGGALAAMTGGTVTSGNNRIRKTEVVTVKTNTATLTGEPVGTTGNEIGYAYLKNENGSLNMDKKLTQNADASSEGTFSFSDGTLTFYEGDVPDNTEVVVFYDADVESAAVDNVSDKYSKTLEMYIDVTCQDNCDNLYHGQFIIPRADFNGTFDITIGSDPSTQAFECSSIAGGCTGSNKLWDFIIFE